eukprot:768456-Prymnesium_polylepis.1
MDEDGGMEFGTAPSERGSGEELGLRLTDGRMVWTAACQRVEFQSYGTSTSSPSAYQPSPPPPHEPSTVEATRAARANKHPLMREHLQRLGALHGSQAKLAAAMGVRPKDLAEYNTGKARSKSLLRHELDSRHRKISFRLRRAGLPGVDAPAPSSSSASHAGATAANSPPS